MALSVLLRLLVAVFSIRLNEAKANSLVTQFSAPGDFIIGGMFAFHSKVRYPAQDEKSEIPKCEGFYLAGYQRHLGMRFAIEEINNSTFLLPGVMLGYEIHNTCNNPAVATKPTLSFLSKYPGNHGVEVQCNYTNYKPRVIAVVGPDNSDLSVLVARLLNFLSIPEISFASSSDHLSDRTLFPSFFRTVPSDRSQVNAMVQLLSKFSWNWVAAFATDNEYGRQALLIFVQLALSKDMCVAYEAILPSDVEEWKREEKLSKIVGQLQRSNINATVIFAQPKEAEELLRVVVERGITGKVWIASECWATSSNIARIPNLESIGTIVGLALRGGEIAGFPEYIHKVLADPGEKRNSSILTEEDEQCPECRYLTLANFSTTVKHSKFYSTLSTYKAVYAIAHALHRLLRCSATSQKCNMKHEVYPWQLLEEVARVNFTVNSQPVNFSPTGDLPTGYDLIFWEETTPGNHEFVVVGSYDPQRSQLSVNAARINWSTENRKPPISRCTQECLPGQKRWLRGEHNCCFLCEDCPADYFQNQRDPHECTPCPRHQWSPPQSTACKDRAFEYLEVSDTLAIAMVALTMLAMAQMAAVTAIFAKRRGTPAVRYVGAFPMLLIVLSSMCFCSSFFFFVIKPSEAVCKLRQPLFFHSFTLSLATLLGKVVQSSGLDRALKRPWLRKHLMGACVLLNTAIHWLLVILWFRLNPPSLEESTELERTILLQCEDSSFPGFSLLLAHDYGLAAVCWLCCFAGHNPERKGNNAASSIRFSMVLILIIWTLFLPAYATSQGKFVALFQVFAGLASLFAIFGPCFYPVCYVVLFAPHMNTDAHFCSRPRDLPADEPNGTETK